MKFQTFFMDISIGLKRKLLLLFFIVSNGLAWSQITHPVNVETRQAIDAKYYSSDLSGKEALLRGREFIRMDSTYYRGYFLEGTYKANHATDFFGFKQAITPLKKGLFYLERDYQFNLTDTTHGLFSDYYNGEIQLAYQQMAEDLFHCYLNTDQYEAAYKLCDRVAAFNMKFEYYFNPYTSKNWIVNKVRTYTQKDYSFLKNSVTENIALAQLYLDTAVMRNAKNEKSYSDFARQLYEVNTFSIYHYRAILYAYSLNIDSADKYYDLLKSQSLYSHNNRGNYLMVKGEFRQAEIEYNNEIASWNPESDKRLKESFYFKSMMALNKNRPDSAILQMKNLIEITGSTPGFGWYNIALARAYLYDGNLQQSKKILAKAAQFKELHIGTSFGALHYNFAVHLLQFVTAQREIEWFKKRNKSYWWKPNLWMRLIALEWNLFTMKYALLSDLEANPERKEVLYQIFATESVVSWEELYTFLPDLDADYFISFFQEQIDSNKRPVINNYFRLFQAKMYYEQGKFKEAQTCLANILNSQLIDEEYEHVFLARVYELQALIALATDKKDEAQSWTQMAYAKSPQTIGFSSLPTSFYIEWDGTQDENIQDALAKANISILKQDNGKVPKVTIKRTQDHEEKTVVLTVRMPDGKTLVQNAKYISEKSGAINYSVLNAMFGMAQTP